MASTVNDTERMLFGAGFSLGVAFTILLFGVVTVTIASRTGLPLLSQRVLATLAAGVFFATIVGVTLYLLAFPENRVDLPVDGLPATATPEDDGETAGD